MNDDVIDSRVEDEQPTATRSHAVLLGDVYIYVPQPHPQELSYKVKFNRKEGLAHHSVIDRAIGVTFDWSHLANDTWALGELPVDPRMHAMCFGKSMHNICHRTMEHYNCICKGISESITGSKNALNIGEEWVATGSLPWAIVMNAYKSTLPDVFWKNIAAFERCNMGIDDRVFKAFKNWVEEWNYCMNTYEDFQAMAYTFVDVYRTRAHFEYNRPAQSRFYQGLEMTPISLIHGDRSRRYQFEELGGILTRNADVAMMITRWFNDNECFDMDLPSHVLNLILSFYCTTGSVPAIEATRRDRFVLKPTFCVTGIKWPGAKRASTSVVWTQAAYTVMSIVETHFYPNLAHWGSIGPGCFRNTRDDELIGATRRLPPVLEQDSAGQRTAFNTWNRSPESAISKARRALVLSRMDDLPINREDGPFNYRRVISKWVEVITPHVFDEVVGHVNWLD
jgi:hypothetical protein